MLLPHLFSVAAIVCASVMLFETVVAESLYYQLVTGMSGGNTVSGGEVTPDEGHLPVIYYGSQWAT